MFLRNNIIFHRKCDLKKKGTNMLLTPIVSTMCENARSCRIFILCWSIFINKCIVQKVMFLKILIFFFFFSEVMVLKNRGNMFFLFPITYGIYKSVQSFRMCTICLFDLLNKRHFFSKYCF